MPELWDFETKSTVEVDDGNVVQALQSGRYGLRDWDVDADGRVRIVTPDGGYGSAPVSNLGELLRGGYRIATDKDEEARRLKRKAEGSGSTAGAMAAKTITALQGFGDIASFGAIPQIAEALGGEDYTAQRQAFSEAHPGSELVGKVAGALVPGAIGRSAGGAVARGLESAGVGALGRTVGSLAGGGAVEGALFGGAELVSDEALGKADIVAQDVLSYVGGGALIGGVTGGVLGVTGHGLRKGAQAILGKVDEVAQARAATLGEVSVDAESVASRLRERGAQIAATLQGKDAETIGRFLDPGKAGRVTRQKAQIGAGADFRKDAARRLTALLDESAKQFDRISDESVGALKAENVRQVITPWPASVDEAMGVVGVLRREVDDILANKDVYTGTLALRYAKQADKYLRGMAPKIESIGEAVAKRGTMETDEAAQLFMAMDQIKRRIGKWSKPGGMLTGVDREGVGRFRDMYEGIRTHLERFELYGDAAAAQKAINAPWAKLLETEQYFRRQFTTRFGTADWDPVFRADGGRIARFLDQVGGPESDLAREALENHVRGQLALSDAIERAFPVGSQAADAAQGLRASGSRLRSMLDDAYEKIELANQLADISEGGRFVNAGKWARYMTAAEDVTGRAFQMAGFERVSGAAQKVDSRIAKAVGRFAKMKPPVTDRGAIAPATAVLFNTQLGPRKRKAKNTQEAFQHRADELAEAIADPQGLADRIAANLGEMDTIAPNVAQAMASKSAQIVNWLYGKLPTRPSGETLTPFATPWEPSPTEVASFARQFKVAVEPLSVLDDMERGVLTKESVEALRELYPDIHTKITGKIAEAAGSRTSPLPYADRVQLSILFGTPLDPTLSPKSVAAMQIAVKGAPPQKPDAQPPAKGRAGGGNRATGLSKVRLGESMMTRTQQIGEAQR